MKQFTEPYTGAGSIFSGIYLGLTLGLASSAMLTMFMRRPLFLTDQGLQVAKKHFIPWHRIHFIQWLPNRPNVLKLRRLSGDFLIQVPEENRGAVHAFIRDKISPPRSTS
jgi:hypothetical protein